MSVLDAGLFEKTNASCLAQGLSFQPGVRVEDDCQNCGFTQVRINGLDGHYSQILVDSHPVFSALTGVYGLEQIPANMIERVEVLRGGGSALFGSSAIGGTINVITKEPSRNSAQMSHTLTSIGGSNSYDNNTMLNASLVTESGRAGLCVFRPEPPPLGLRPRRRRLHRSARHQQPVGGHALVLPYGRLFAHHGAVPPYQRIPPRGRHARPAAPRGAGRRADRPFDRRGQPFVRHLCRPTAATVSTPMSRSRIRRARATTAASRIPMPTGRRTT